MSLCYYSRIRFINKLLPLLIDSQASASVISVYGAGLEGKLFTSDLSLRDAKNYSFANARSHIVHFTTMAFEHIAKEHRGHVSLVHVFPGIVVTPGYSDEGHPWWFKLAWRCVGPVVQRLQAISAEESGERVLYLATGKFGTAEQHAQRGKLAKGTDDAQGSDAYAIGKDGESVALKTDYRKLRQQGFEQMVWEHTCKAFEEIEAGKKFTG